MNEMFARHKITPGWVEVICGCMFSGKTEELIKQIHRAQLARLNCLVFKPRIDDRYSKNEVASHSQSKCPSIVIDNADEILPHIEKKTDIVGIDEVQFYDHRVIDVVSRLADAGKRVIVAGLDTDWQGRPFGPIPTLLATADVIHKQYAICMVCGDPATRTQRLVPDKENILVGSSDMYEARCRSHFDSDLSLRVNFSGTQQSHMQHNHSGENKSPAPSATL